MRFIQKYCFLAFPVIFYQFLIFSLFWGFIAMMMMIIFGISMLVNRKYLGHEYKSPVLNVVLFVVIWIGAHSNMVIQQERGIKGGLKLIAVLEEYYVDYGKYPSTLDELQPKYIKSIPYFWFGVIPTKFKYSKNKISYTLDVHENAVFHCTFGNIGMDCFD